MDYTATSAQAAARALDEVILPALVAGHNAPAIEQAHLVRDFLAFVADRVDLLGARKEFQHRHALDLAEAVEASDAASLPSAAHDRLRRSIANAAAMRRAPAASDARTASVEELDGAVGDVLREAAESGDVDRSTRLRRLVIERMRMRIEADRAWLAPMGFDPDPDSLADLTTLLHA